MDGAVGWLRVAERSQASHHHVLQVRLARINHVVDALGLAEGRRGLVSWTIGGRPHYVAIRISEPAPVIKILSEKPELPELVSNVLSDIRNRAVGAHDHLAVFFPRIFRKS